MDFHGFIKTSLIDYPDKISSVAFVSGCNFRCGYCHNKDLVEGSNLELVLNKDVVSHMIQRKGVIDGLVISGGEPTLHPKLLYTLRVLKQLDIPVKLDTNGSRPDVIEAILKDGLVSYIAMDVKADLEHYDQVTGVSVDFEKIRASIKLIRESDIEYEFRTTLLKTVHDKAVMANILKEVKGAKKYVMQQYFENASQIKKFDYGFVTLSDLFEMKEYLESLNLVDDIDIRGKH